VYAQLAHFPSVDNAFFVGRCNYLRFLPIFGEKNAFFIPKNQYYDPNFAKTSSTYFEQKTPTFFGENILKSLHLSLILLVRYGGFLCKKNSKSFFFFFSRLIKYYDSDKKAFRRIKKKFDQYEQTPIWHVWMYVSRWQNLSVYFVEIFYNVEKIFTNIFSHLNMQ
jgi:hypothetical protein